MLSLCRLLYGSCEGTGEADDTAFALKAPSPAFRRKRLEESSNLRRYGQLLSLPPQDELVSVFDPEWTKRRTVQSNNELYLTVSQVEVKVESRASWLAYASYLTWCGEAAASNLFFRAGATLYRDAALIYVKSLRDAPEGELSRSIARLECPELLHPLLEILEGYELMGRTLLWFGNPLADTAQRSVIEHFDTFLGAAGVYGVAGEADSPADPGRCDALISSFILTVKAAGVVVFDPERRANWRQELPDVQDRIRGTLERLERHRPGWREIEARERLVVAQRALAHVVSQIAEGEPSKTLTADRRESLARIADLLRRGGTESIDALTLLVSGGTERAADECARTGDLGGRLLYLLFRHLHLALAPTTSGQARVAALGQALAAIERLRAPAGTTARKRFAEGFVPLPMQEDNVAHSLAGWHGTPKLRSFLLRMGGETEESLSPTLDGLLQEASAEAKLPDDFYVGLVNILGRKGYPGLAGLAEYHLALRQIDAGRVGTALGSLGLCFDLLEKAFGLDASPIWYRWTYEIACHAATRIQKGDPEHGQGTEMLKEVAMLALRDLKRLQ